MNRPWFDAETGMLLLDEYVEAMPSFRNVMQDGTVTDDELDHHAHRVVDLLQQLDKRLPSDLKTLATDALCELAVLYALQRRHSEQHLRF
jgi:ferritin-like protein